jgi:hypothetical protein
MGDVETFGYRKRTKLTNTPMIEQLIALSTVMLAISLATERFVALVKSFWPWLAEERKDANNLIDVVPERKRILAVQLVSLVGAYLTTSLANDSFNLARDFCFGDPKACWPAALIALLGSGGSAFWTQLLGYANAVKEVKKQQRAEQRLNLAEQANQRGISINKLSKI